jgi:hypothetical protein
MKFSVTWRPSVPASASPWRVLDERGREVAWANTFLDAQRVRQLSLRSLRAYAFDLLHFARWGAERPPLSQTTESTLLDYARLRCSAKMTHHGLVRVTHCKNSAENRIGVTNRHAVRIIRGPVSVRGRRQYHPRRGRVGWGSSSAEGERAMTKN